MDSVLILAPSAYPLGGVATWLDYIVPGLEARGWRVTVGLTQGQFHDSTAYLAAHPLSRTVLLECATGSREGRVRAVQRAIRDVSPDLVTVVDVPDAFEALRRLRGRNGGPKVVMALHNILPGMFDDMRDHAHVVDSVIATNRLACALAERFGTIETERIQYAPCGVEIPPFMDRDAETGPLRVLYAGRLERVQKRVDDVREIVDEADRRGLDIVFLVVGAGTESASLREVMGRRAKARFCQGVPRARMLTEVYGEADVLLVTSQWETGPLVVWEALAAGLAVVSSAYIGSGLEGGLRHGENCLMFHIGDVREAVNHLAALRVGERRRALAAAGRKLAVSHYSCEVSIEAWDRSLRNVLRWPLTKRRRMDGGSTPGGGGRLDRVAGVRMAEVIRWVLRRHFAHKSASEEWPYINGTRPMTDQEFWACAASLDRGANEHLGGSGARNSMIAEEHNGVVRGW